MVRHLQQITRREAKYCDLDGLYPLHWTVSGGPPTDVVQALLDHYPSTAHKADSEGSLPLHFACHYSASVGVIEALLQVYPKAIRAKDKYGRTPLYHAVDKAASIEVHEMLVKADPTMVTVPCLPASLLQDYERQQPVGANTSRGVAIRTPLFLAWVAVRSDSRTRRERKQGKKWDKAILLLRVAYHQGFIKDDSPKVPFNTTLHAAISLDVYLPEQVILMVTEAYPGQLERVETVNGQLPLALAADLSHYSNCRSDFLIELLLQAFPRAVESRDRRGRFPLSLALASGKRLDTGVQRLLQAAPDTIFWRDGLTGLVPALEAASATTQDDQVVSSYPVEIAKDPFCLLNTKQRESIAHWRRRSLGLLSTPPTIKSKNEKDTISNSPETCNVATIYELISAHPSVLIRNPAS